MKIDKLSKEKSKKIILSIVILLFIIGIIYITNSKAKYQVTKNVQIVNGNVNYSLADLNVLALQVQSEKGSETYTLEDEVPIGNYEVNIQKSYCKYPGDNAEHRDIPMEYKDEKVSISISKKGTKCYVYLDFRKEESEKTMNNLSLELTKGIPNFDKTSCDKSIDSTCEEETNGLFQGTETINGKERNTYYFRGSVDNNWVSFAGYYWRIIRINGNGSIRIIYNGTSAGATGKSAQLENGKTQRFSISDSAKDDNAYVGYKYGMLGQSQNLEGYNKTHTNTYESGIKTYIDSWYTSSLMNKPAGSGNKTAKDYIDIETGFCGDRSPYQWNRVSSSSQLNKNQYGAGKTPTYYGAYIRTALQPRNPTFDCPNSNDDLYTVSGAKEGNHALDNPIGLITADEVNFAGGRNASNSGYWLCTGEQGYWTMSPSGFSGSIAYVLYVISNGNINGYDVYVDYSLGVRPVINLKSDTQFTGEGTTGNPFVVQ